MATSAKDLASGGPSGTGAAVGAGASGGSGGSGGGQTMPPETENDDTYSAPVVSGRWVWSANPQSGKVALIDTSSMRVTTSDAGLAPTYVAALGESDEHTTAAIVLNVGNDTASVLHAVDGEITAESLKVHAGANRMTVSPSGRWALVWSDAGLLTNPDPTEGLQDVTVLDLGVVPAVSYALTVGYRPSRVTIGEGEEHAYFVTEPGISVVDLPATDPPSVARDVAVTESPEAAALVRDVTVTPDGSTAVVRHDQSPTVSIVSLDGGASVDVILPGPVTDLDLAPSGDVAFAVVRGMPGGAGTAGSGGSGVGGTSSGGTGGAGAGGNGGTSSGGAPGSGTGGGGSGNPGAGNEAGALDQGGQSGAADVGLAGQVGTQGGAPSGGSSSGGALGESGAPAAGGAEAGGPGESGAPGVGGSSGRGTGGHAGSGTGGSAGGGTTGSSASYVAALPLAAVLRDPKAFDLIAIDDTVGSIVIAPAGDTALLYTNATPSDHVAILDTKRLALVRTVLVKSPVKAVLPSMDGLHAVAVLDRSSDSKKPGGFSLIHATGTLAPKILSTAAPVQAVALGVHQGLITVEGTDPTTGNKVHAVILAQLPDFGTTTVTLGSPPISTGIIPDPTVNLGFVAQSHPEGRITFLDLDTGAPRTLTGFELSAKVVQRE